MAEALESLGASLQASASWDATTVSLACLADRLDEAMALLAEAHTTFGVVSPFGGPTSSGMLTLHCPPASVYGLASFLRDKGADSITVAEIDYVFAPENPLYARLMAAL